MISRIYYPILDRKAIPAISIAVLLILSVTAIAIPVSAAKPLVVDDDGAECPEAGYTNIQDAVDAANPGDRIIVCAGTYVEQVTIDKSLKLVGTGNPTVQAPAIWTGDKSIVTVKGADVVVRFTGFTVSGPFTGIFSGILVRDGAHADIYSNQISDIRDDPLSGPQRGWGIVVGGDGRYGLLASTGRARIVDNILSGFQKGGIIVAGASSAMIWYNTLTGTPTTAIAQDCIHVGNDAYDAYGFPIGNGAFASIVGNEVSECRWTGGWTWGGAAIFLSGPAGGTSIRENDIYGNRWGVFVDYSRNKRVMIVGNNIHDNPGVGIQIWYGWNVAIRRNQIVNTGFNTDPGNPWPTTSDGLDIQLTFWPGGNEAHVNKIAGNIRKGVEIWGDAYGWGASPVPGPFRAESNWWGSSTGPTHTSNPGGTGDVVDDDVDFTPWLKKPIQ